ncbi:MAG: 3'(2'),5'-bisphosphate nucleotidase CysQ, partial [Polyangiaceae bacterium]|nr:3'(2'),5'-bisphosphate nucleotidase CysQ [Polyangiaceae bacterium]
CLVAAAEADLYVSLSDHSRAWDSCGPEAIVRAAGGRFVDLAGRPLVYDPSSLRNLNGLMASNAACFDRVMPEIRSTALRVGLL